MKDNAARGVLRYGGGKKARLIFSVLLLEIVFLYAHTVIGRETREELRLINEVNMDIAEAKESLLYKRGILSRYEEGITQLQPILPRNVRSITEAAAFISECYVNSGVTAEVKGNHNGEVIVVTADGECAFSDMLSFLGRLSEVPYAARIASATIMGHDGQTVRFQVRIDFLPDGYGSQEGEEG